MNLADLQREAHAIAKDHGWWDEERTFGDLIALVHSELSEALEAYRENPTMGTSLHNPPEAGGSTVVGSRFLVKPEGVASELADVVIRVADMAEYYGVDLAHQVAQLKESNWTRTIYGQVETFGDWITQCHCSVSTVMLHYWERESSGDNTGARQWFHITLLVKYLELMAAHYGIDLDAAIEAKMEYNRTRSYRHGGKAL